MNTTNFRRTKLTCYFTYPALASIFFLPPILFYTFRQMYGISYTLLGTLVLVNFCTQMVVDLIFTFFSKHFNPHKTIRTMPLLTAVGLVTYAVIPWLFPQYAYIGLLIGTFIFSVSAGLCEVLLSPTVAALPSDDPERDMSTLHSLYGYGAAGVVVVSTVFLQVFGTENWMYLTLLLAILPVICFILFQISPLPEFPVSQAITEGNGKKKRTGLILCAACIFLGSAAENTMSNWISVYMESALRLPKLLGDTLGLTCFTLLLAFTRTWYAKYGKNIFKTLMLGMVGAVICYIAAGISSSAVVAIVACMLTGLCTSMLWPGTLILMEDRFPNPGVAAYALMAVGGDFGASVAPQGMGMIVDAVAASPWAGAFGEKFSLTAEQIGMKTGMLAGALFPIFGICILLGMKKYLYRK